MNKDIKKILLHFDNDHQKLKTIEELSELIRAVVREDRGNIIEEIADVEIMISQLKMIYLIDQKEIEDVKREKITKVLFKINNDRS